MKTDNSYTPLESGGTDTNFYAGDLAEEITIEEAAREARKFSKKFCANVVDIDLGNGL